jgi:hypothetical protein
VPDDRDLLLFDDGLGEWVAGTLTTDDVTEGANLYFTDQRADDRIAAADLGDLSDVDTVYAVDGEVLRLVGGLWTGSTLDLDDLGDVTAPTPTAGDVLTYDGAAWVPVEPESPIGLIIALGG